MNQPRRTRPEISRASRRNRSCSPLRVHQKHRDPLTRSAHAGRIMQLETRTLLVGSCLALLAAGCGGGAAGPTSPSGPAAPGQTAATISGTVNGARALSSLAAPTGPAAAGAPSDMTVRVMGTSLSAVVDTSGQFVIDGVPAGNVELMFTYANVSAKAPVSNIGDEELIQINVNVSGRTATIVDEVRSSGKVSICHGTGNGSYHLIEVSVNAEPAHKAHGDGKIGDPVPADTTKVFDSNCQASGSGSRDQEVHERPGRGRGAGTVNGRRQPGQLAIRRHQHGQHEPDRRPCR